MAELTDQQKEAMEQLQGAVAEFEQCKDVRDRLAEQIVAALRAGVKPSDVDKVVPYDRNHIRRIAKAAGVPPLRQPTVRPRGTGT